MPKLYQFDGNKWNEIGKNGADGSPDTGFEIVAKLSELKGKDRLSLSDLKDVPNFLSTKERSVISSKDYSFLELTDVPKSYTSQGGKVIAVKTDGTGLEFIPAGAANAFVQGGNSFGTLATLGTNDNNNMAIIANGVEVMRIRAQGQSVGIGTNNPVNKLHVYEDTAGVAGFRVQNPNGGVFAQIQNVLQNNNGWLAYYGISSGGYGGFGPINGGKAYFGSFLCDVAMFTQTGNEIGFWIGTTPRLKIRTDGATAVLGRLETSKGVDVASANDLTLGGDGNKFVITGVTDINAITTANWIAGSEIRLFFISVVTVKHNVGGGAGTAKMALSGGVDFVTSNPSNLTLSYDGSVWQEVCRSINHA